MAMASETIAGSGEKGFAEGVGAVAQFNNPFSLVVDNEGSIIVADGHNHRIRRITAAGVVSTIAGSGVEGFTEGVGVSAQFRCPVGLAIDRAGNIVVGDADNHRIRRVTAAGVVSTIAGSGEEGFADGVGTAAQFASPCALAVDHDNNIIVADRRNHRIRRITVAGEVSTIAGSGEVGFADGVGTAAQFNCPHGLAIDGEGSIIIADTRNHRIRRVTAAGVVSTIAGSGVPGFAEGMGTAAEFNY